MTQTSTPVAQGNRIPVDTSTIPGWGVDADPKNDPTYPMRDRSKDDTPVRTWDRPTQQTSDTEILQSMEFLHKPAVFGTTVPPSGLSGMMRRVAFRWSESNWLHWLILMGADRVNVVEGVVADLAHGTVPNVPGELGARAEWQHNKSGFAIKTVVALGLVAGAVALSRRGAKD